MLKPFLKDWDMKNKIFFCILAIATLYGCKNANEVYYKEETLCVPINDTICFPEQHLHLEEEQKCLWCLEEEIIINDTICCTILIPIINEDINKKDKRKK